MTGGSVAGGSVAGGSVWEGSVPEGCVVVGSVTGGSVPVGSELWLPEGWQASHYQKTLSLPYPQPLHGLKEEKKMTFTVTVGEKVEEVMRAYMEVTCPTLCYPVMIPIVLIG